VAAEDTVSSIGDRLGIPSSFTEETDLPADTILILKSPTKIKDEGTLNIGTDSVVKIESDVVDTVDPVAKYGYGNTSKVFSGDAATIFANNQVVATDLLRIENGGSLDVKDGATITVAESGVLVIRD